LNFREERMNAPHAATAAAASAASPAAANPAATTRRRRVVDAPTRTAHGLFAASFTGAYLTGDSESWRALHVTLGYTMAVVLGFRLLYGLLGPPQARLGLLWRRLGALPAWLRELLASRSLAAVPWQKGAMLGLGLSMAALLALAVPLALSGYATHAEWGGEWLEEVHEFFANAALGLVLWHLALIAVLSVLRRRNLARPMLSGTADGPGPDLVKSDRKALAIGLLLTVLAFAAWQWQPLPQGWGPDGAGDARGLRHERQADRQDHDDRDGHDGRDGRDGHEDEEGRDQNAPLDGPARQAPPAAAPIES
jgi:cytochrome b